MAKTNLVIWEVLRRQGRSYSWLAQKTGYSYSLVRNVCYGTAEASPRFQAECARALEIPASVLFSEYRPDVEPVSA